MRSIILGAPYWTWVILVYLIFIGIKAMQKRVVYLPKLFIVPIVLTALKYKVFLSGDSYILAIYFILNSRSVWALWAIYKSHKIL